MLTFNQITKIALLGSLSTFGLLGCGSDNDGKVTVIPYDTTKPTLTLNQASEPILTNQTKMLVTGTVTDNSAPNELTIQVTNNANSQTTKPDQNGKFSLDTPLVAGQNTITVTVTDKNGNQTTQTLMVTLDNTQPTLTLVNIADKEISRTRLLRLQGLAKDNSSQPIRIHISNQTTKEEQNILVSNDIAFETVMTLAAGNNELQIIATDKAGNQIQRRANVYYGQSLAAANSHTGALVSGKLYAWGRNNFGQVGLGNVSTLRANPNLHPSIPTLISNAPSEIVSISFNQNHSALLTKSGKVYTWGSDESGELGRGTAGRNDCGRGKANCRLDIGEVTGLPAVVAMASGYGHRLVLSHSGEVWAFGSNSDGQLGQPTNIKDSAVPVKIDFGNTSQIGRIIQIAAGADTSYALDDKGQVWAWGSNEDGNLGVEQICEHGQTINCLPNRSQPEIVPMPKDVTITEIAVGKSHILALTEKGQIYAWGLNFSSQIGYRGDDVVNTSTAWPEQIGKPTLLPWSQQKTAKHVYANGNTSYVMLNDRKVYPWGMYGETNAQGKTEYPELSEPTDKLSNLTQVNDMAVGALHQIAKRQDGGLFSWGWSFEGSLGAGATVQNTWMQNLPISIAVKP